MPRKSPDLVRPRGRPRKGETPALVPSAAKAAKNITVDADLVDILNATADELAETFGFRPTLSQTLRHLVNTRKPTP